MSSFRSATAAKRPVAVGSTKRHFVQKFQTIASEKIRFNLNMSNNSLYQVQSSRSETKDAALSRAALETWASEELQRKAGHRDRHFFKGLTVRIHEAAQQNRERLETLLLSTFRNATHSYDWSGLHICLQSSHFD